MLVASLLGTPSSNQCSLNTTALQRIVTLMKVFVEAVSINFMVMFEAVLCGAVELYCVRGYSNILSILFLQASVEIIM